VNRSFNDRNVYRDDDMHPHRIGISRRSYIVLYAFSQFSYESIYAVKEELETSLQTLILSKHKRGEAFLSAKYGLHLRTILQVGTLVQLLLCLLRLLLLR
jgi:hypothetical protein